ncbi:MAG: ECF transporter S component [Clostridiales bacterium]|jgi:riboflavin transporter FmnP|nr:ECF transporter S component [Clostridiales bacterium]
MSHSNSRKTVFYIVRIAMLAAISTVLMYFSIPIVGPYRLDFSNLAVIIGTFAMGPLAGIIILLIKDLLNMIMDPSTFGIGQLADFICSFFYIIPAGLIYMHRKSKKSAVTGLVTGSITAIIAACLSNYYVLIPLFSKAFHMSMNDYVSSFTNAIPLIKNFRDLIIFATIPFNLSKFGALSVITVYIYKHISKLLAKLR